MVSTAEGYAMIKKKIIFALTVISFINIFAASEEAESQDDSEEISVITVSASLETPVVEQRQSFTHKDIEQLHSPDLPSLLQSAGIQILSYGTYGLEQKASIRGFTDETVRVIIDGICVNNAQYGTFDFTTVNLNDVEKIEIVRGGFTEGVSDEGAVGGAVYITTKKNKKGHSFNSDTCLTSYLNQKYPLDTVSQSLGYSGAFSESTFFSSSIKGSFAKNAFQYENTKKKVKTRENAEVFDLNGSVKLSHNFAEKNSWTISNLTYYGDKNTPGFASQNLTGNQKDINNNLSFNVNLPAIKDCFYADNTVNWITNNRFYEENDDLSIHYINSFRYTFQSEFFKFNFYRQSFGVTADFTTLNSTNDGIHNQITGTFKETSKFFFGNHFSMTVPLAVKFCGSNFEFIPKLGLGLTFKYAEFFLNGYRMVQFPNMDDLYWDSNGYKGNPDLTAESGWGSEFTANAKIPYAPFSITFFYNYYKDKIQWRYKDNSMSPQNAASAWYFGIDFLAEQNILGFISIKESMEYLYNQLIDPDNDLTDGNHIMWTPDFTGSVIFSLNAGFAVFSVDASYTGKRYTDNLNVTYLKPYFLLNAGMDLTIWEHCIPYLKVNNILNESYESIPDYPMPGISIQLGLKFL